MEASCLRYGEQLVPCAYYNEIDPKAAAWLRELIHAGHIAKGEVDERSIVDVRGSELTGYTQCHFFAGIGVWSHALRQAGWPDDRQVWTGSCPCQSFSAAGSGGGFDDERHLWPHFFRLIQEQRPCTVFGEQVASADGLAWLDFVCADMESEGYAIAPLDLCAAGFGAPHIRQRLFFVADAGSRTSQRDARGVSTAQAERGSQGKLNGHLPVGHSDGGAVGGLADSAGSRQVGSRRSGASSRRVQLQPVELSPAGVALGDAEREGSQGRIGPGNVELHGEAGQERPTPTAGFWRDCDWLPCRDGKARAVEPGTFPLAHGSAARVGRLRGYGNAIVAPVAEEFIRAYLECAS